MMMKYVLSFGDEFSSFGMSNEPQCSTDIHQRYHQLPKAILFHRQFCRGQNLVWFLHLRKLLHMSMLNAVIISGMSIVSFIIKHIHFSDRNVMLRSVSDRIDGGSPGVCVWEIGQVLPGLCFFPSETHLSYRRGRGRIGWMFQCSCWSASS